MNQISVYTTKRMARAKTNEKKRHKTKQRTDARILERERQSGYLYECEEAAKLIRRQ